MSTQDSTTNSTSGTSQAAEQNASFQQFLRRKKKKICLYFVHLFF